MLALRKYLNLYAEPEALLLDDWPQWGNFEQVLVLPAFDESPAFAERLQSRLFQQQSVLAIIIVNRPDNVLECPANGQLLQFLGRDSAHWYSRDKRLFLKRLGKSALLVTNRHDVPIPRVRGVGQARKIGADIACALIDSGYIGSAWIHSTDADAHLPADYLQASGSIPSGCVAGCFDFTHRDDGSPVALATRYYEQRIRQYRDGLSSAGSPYAFHTIGSTLVFDYRAYAAARGFPKRAAGEDFYLLNKLAKLGNVASLTTRIELTPRLSTRVPFGTGPASREILATLQRGDPVTGYNEKIFTNLALWLKLAESGICDAEESPLRLVEEARDRLPEAVVDALATLDLPRCEAHLNRGSNSRWRLQHFRHWFDAFRTMKFVNYLQAHGFPPQPLNPSR